MGMKPSASPIPAGQCQSILIVEDDDDIRAAMVELLEAEHYAVSAAKEGEEGLELLREMKAPTLILLDLMMPGMNGWDFLEAQKENPVYATLPVVIVSALRPSTVLGQKNIPNQPAAFLKKPIAIDALLQVVKQYCGEGRSPENGG